jgi:hypothetical protein
MITVRIMLFPASSISVITTRNRTELEEEFLSTQHWDSYNNAPIKRALVLGTLYCILRFSDPLESAVLPVTAHWPVELRDHGYPAHVLNKSIKALSNTIITRPLRGSISRLWSSFWSHLSTTTPHLISHGSLCYIIQKQTDSDYK